MFQYTKTLHYFVSTKYLFDKTHFNKNMRINEDATAEQLTTATSEYYSLNFDLDVSKFSTTKSA